MLIGGAVFAATYVAAAGLGSYLPGTNYGLIPIAGPFILAGQLLGGYPCEHRASDVCGANLVFISMLATGMAVDGIAQLGGATLLLCGALAPDKAAAPERPSARVIPFASPEGGGLAVLGRF